MTRPLSYGLRLLLLAFLALCPALPAQDAARSAIGKSVFLDRAIDLERRQLWQQAADLYQRALRAYPDDSELHQRWRYAEQLYSLSRRYHDNSFQKDLLQLSEQEALELYREVLAKIQTHYVRAIPLRDLVGAGLRTLDLAMDRPVFLAVNFPNTSEANLKQLEPRLEAAAAQVGEISNLQIASAHARRASQLCATYGCRYPAAPILEMLSGACESLDPYSSHLSPNRLDELYAMIDGNFVGLGVEVRGEEEGLKILEVLPQSPAERAGLLDGDVIIAIDGSSLNGMNAEDAANRLQGPSGSRVALQVRRGDQPIVDISVERREVVVHSIRDARLLEGAERIGYLAIDSFQKHTETELSENLRRLERLGMRSLVIDLRGNPGGLLDVSLDAANQFIDSGVLVSTRGRAFGQNWEHRAKSTAIHRLPLVVLVDSESASASEIFASAIQDHHRGTVVGTKTYGKGSVESIFPLTSSRTGLRLTTALFYSPKGKRLQGVGVEPDLMVVRGEGKLGEEPAVPRKPELSNDAQLRAAIESLTTPLANQAR